MSRALANRLLTDCDVLTIQDLLELHGGGDPVLQVLLACMFAELNRGSLCLRIPSAACAAVLEDIGATASAAAIQDGLKKDGWRGLIGAPGEFVPLIRVSAGDGEAEYLYFQRYYEYEKRVRAHILARIKAAPIAIPVSQAREAVSEVLALWSRLSACSVPRRLDSLRHEQGLAGAQKGALALAMRQRFLIISGGPGTGKTTGVVSILRGLARLGCAPQRILLAAPTGRAAYRLTDSIRAGLGAVREAQGKLADVDSALLSLEARTIHRLLEYRPSRHDFVHRAENPLPADVVVIDEVSMLDAGLMASLLEAVPAEARLIFLGDKNQLPSVEAGAMLADLIPPVEAPNYSPEAAQWVRAVTGIQWPPAAGSGEPLDHVVVLTENYRSVETDIAEVVECLTGLPNKEVIEAKLFSTAVALHPAGEKDDEASILSCLWPSAGANPKGYHFAELTAEWADRRRWPRLLRSWASHHYLAARAGRPSYQDLVLRAAAQADFTQADHIAPELARDILSCVRAGQILTILRNGRFGCAGVNAVLMQSLAHKLDRHAASGYFAGLPIIVTRNDYALNLFNGDAGVILRDRNGLCRALFQRRQSSTGLECLALDRLPPWEPALAITVHKSQGSEYGDVLLIVPPDQEMCSSPLAGAGGERGRDGPGQASIEAPAQRLLTAEILYTGLTRARRLALLCGTRSMILQAATRRVERSSGLAQR
ncbi:MAG: exodeoxyribonuclease V subunit alpha [Planctomycetota bacterium]